MPRVIGGWALSYGRGTPVEGLGLRVEESVEEVRPGAPATLFGVWGRGFGFDGSGLRS